MPEWLPLLRRPLPSRLSDAIVVTGLLVAGVIFTHDLPRLADVRVWDDALYLERGLRLAQDGWPPVQYGPLYSIYLWLLSKLIPDPVQIQFASLAQVTLALPPLLFLLLRAARVPLAIAWPAAAFFLISYANLHLQMPVAHFALILAVPFCTMALHAGSLTASVRWLLGGTLLASYVRPEYFLSFLFFVPIWLFAEWRTARASPGPLRWRGPALFGAALLLPLVCLGAPAFIGGNGREMTAFGQHFARRWAQWQPTELNPYFEWELIVSRVFGPVSSPAGALFANPAQFLHFLWDNVAGLVSHGPRVYLLHFQLPRWAGGGAFKPWDGLLFVGALATWSVALARKFRPQPAPERTPRVWLLGPLLVPGLLSAVLVYPTDYYLLPVAIFGGTIALGLLHRRTPAHPPHAMALAAGLAAMVALTPSLAATEYAQRDRALHRLVTALRDLRLRPPLRLLEADGGLNVFLGADARSFQSYEMSGGFARFLREHDINVIVSSDYLEHGDIRFKDDAEWREFRRAPEVAGFTLVSVPSPARRIYIRRDRLPGPPP